jgi:hypothetical protein
MSSTYAYILLNSLVNDPKYKTVLTLVKGIRNGMNYTVMNYTVMSG